MNENPDNQDHKHLSAVEVSRWLIEGPTAESQTHIDNCWNCQAKLAEAEAPLTAFRSALVGWSEARSAVLPLSNDEIDRRSDRRWLSYFWLPAASVALATILLVGFLAGSGLVRRSHSGALPAATAVLPDSDSALMNQVDVEVSEAVPDALAPLTDLVAWDSDEQPAVAVSSHVTVSEKHQPHKKATAPKPQASAKD